MKLDIESYSMESSKKKVTGKFINRELSWISFNSRVLYYVKNKSIPLNERLKFLAITESNMDEFISVRFANAYKHQDEEPYKEILSQIIKFNHAQEVIFSDLHNYLKEKKKLEIVKIKTLSKKEKESLYRRYYQSIFPLLTPVIINSGNYSPNLISGQLCIGVTLKKDNKEVLCVIPISNEIDHLISLDKRHYVLIEDIIKSFAGKSLFINEEITNICSFRMIKDASIILSHDNNRFIVDRMEEVLQKRQNSEPMFLEIEKSASDELERILIHAFHVPPKHIYRSSVMLKYKRFMSPLLSEEDSYESFEPFVFENYENYFSLFDALKDRDILLHHPYDSYETVVKFIQHASYDKDVVAIKQTLYRVSSINSPIVEALCNAAKNGKKVSVLIEIKARFDEENNINLIEKLKNAGATVLLGTEYLKTHCKMCIVIRKEKEGLKVYSHMGTGNYNEKTARQYTDISFLTSRRKIGIDLLNIFNILSGHSRPDEKLEKISYSPVNLRKTLEKNIDREIKYAKDGKRAEIFIKVNSISDPMIIDKLYKASNAGVKIYIVCRGICSIVAKRNIYIKSIVGRFLEHSRIYYFYNNKNPEYYISSADLLTRNLDRRVEVLISLKDTSVIKQVDWIIKVFKEDQRNSFIQNTDGKWQHMSGDFDCHEWFIQYSDIKKSKKKWRK